MPDSGSRLQAAPAANESRRAERPAGNGDVRAVLTLAAAIVTVVWLAIVLLWEPSTAALTFDDAFYYLEIGRHVAEGSGSTFDGINETNGYHPLWMGMVTGLFAAGLEGDGAARVALAVQVVLGWGACLLILAQIAARCLGRWPKGARASDAAVPARWTLFALVLVAGGSPYVVKTFVNGMESAIAASLQATVLWLAVERRGRWLGEDRSVGGQLAVGALLAMVFLARTDAVLLLACLGIWVLVELTRSTRRGRDAGQAVALFAPAAAVALAYVVWNAATFGTWMQVSGLIKRADPSVVRLGLFAGFLALAGLIMRRGLAHAVAGGTGAAPAARPSGRFPIAGRFVDRTGFYAAFCIILIGYYNLLQTQQWLWYYAPVVFYVLVLCTLGVADIVQATLRDAPAGMPTRRALLPAQLIVAVPLALLLVFGVVSFVDPASRSIIEANEVAGAWLADNLDDGAVVASWDAGMLGYASGGRVLNLDGVVNSYEFYEANQQGAGAVADFLACAGVTHIANHGADLDGEDPSTRAFIATLWGDEVAADARVVHRVPFVYSGRTVGSGGSGGGGDLAVLVYELPGDPAGRCPS